MLRRTVCTRGAGRGLPLNDMYPNGVPKRTTPLRDLPKHPAVSPAPGGWWLSKHGMGFPLHAPFEFHFYRAPFMVTAAMIFVDYFFGFPTFFQKEKDPRASSHYFMGNNGGVPHHLWCYQDGWYMPNHSGVKRMVQ